jgi:hypothetical protein
MRRGLGALALAGVAASGAACARGRERARPATSVAERSALAVRQQYTSRDVVPAAAYTWTGPDSTTFVLVAVESGVEGVVRARADLWIGGGARPLRLAHSDVIAAAATIGAYTFEDVTGDGLPDLLGYVADSSGAAYPVFMPGARGMLIDELERAAPGFRLSAEPERAPTVVTGPRGPCALRLWAEPPTPDSQPEGWRYLTLLGAGRLGTPAAAAPACAQ